MQQAQQKALICVDGANAFPGFGRDRRGAAGHFKVASPGLFFKCLAFDACHACRFRPRATVSSRLRMRMSSRLRMRIANVVAEAVT